MKISIACPEAVRQNQSVLLNDGELAFISVDGGLLVFDLPGETHDENLQILDDSEKTVGGWIADANDAVEIRALGALKASICEVQRHVQRESSYATRASESAEATSDAVVSHLQGEQHTSTDDSSEQHGAATTNDEENVNEQALEKAEQPARRRR
jgi:hypothetical protein